MSKRIQGLVTLLVVLLVSWLVGYYLIPMFGGEEADPSLPPPELIGDPYVDDFRHLTWLLREKWSWLKLREEQGLDLSSLEAEALALSAAEPGDRGFLRGLTRYVAGLNDGHASVELAGVDLSEERQWPFTLIEVAEGVMVDGIGPAVFASKALARGDLILAIDDVPIDEVIAAEERFVIASTPTARRRKAIFALPDWTARETLRVRAQRMGEIGPITVEVPCLDQSEPVPKYAWRHFAEKVEELDDDIAYFCVGTFAHGSAEFANADPEARHEILSNRYDDYARIFERFSGKSSLVLDLRGNSGGTDLLGQALALHLMEPGFRYLKLGYKKRGRWRQTDWQRPEVGRGAPRFTGRVVCLVDENSFSVTDNFASCLRDEHPNVVFVGQPTGGGSGAPRSFSLPSTNARVRFCTLRAYAPNGTPVEGNGVQPDIVVRPSRAQMLADEDATLLAALTELRAR